MREAGQVVGVVGLQNAEGVGLLRSLAVLPSLHGQGRGGALVAAVERLAEQRGIDDLYLLTDSVPGFFALHDYLRVQRASVPLGDPGHGAVRVAVPLHRRVHAQAAAAAAALK